MKTLARNGFTFTGWVVALWLLSGQVAQAQATPLINAHAHNDYEHKHPLLDALDNGFCSVEADVYLVGGKLLVAHDADKVSPERTLEILYLDPLRALVKKNGGRLFKGGPPASLLIDVKSEPESTYAAISEALKNYTDILTRFDHGKVVTNAITVIISGFRPKQTMAAEAVRYAGMDGRLDDLKGNDPASLIPWMSDNWTKVFKWRGIGSMPDDERKKLKQIVDQSHAQGRRVRFWSTADKPAFWQELIAAKVDIINVDDLPGLKNYLASAAGLVSTTEPDLILHHGKIVSVDNNSSIYQAIAIKGEKILALGDDATILARKTASTKLIDLRGKTVIPGLIDSHVHPAAAMTEFDHPLPQMETIQQVLDYVRSRAKELKDGEWINLRQVFITRLREQRYPTRAELDQAAPRHPVNFSTGPDNMLNSLAMKLSGIDKNFKVTDGGPGHVEIDPKTGEANGLLRGLARFVKSKDPSRKPTEKDYHDRLLELFKDYNSVGLTMVCDRSATPDYIERYEKMLAANELPIRMAISYNIATLGPIEKIESSIRRVAEHPLFKGGPRLRIIGIKIFLDGGMLTGSAYMRQPWGDSEIYGITDPTYRGVLNVPRERLLPMVRAATESGLQFTAHSVGDGAVHLLLDVYEEVNKSVSVRKTRGCITHSNFMSREAVEQAARLGVVLDIQPAWLYLDTRTLVNQFGYDRLRYFQPLKSIFDAGAIAGGGSDHMQKIGSLRSINPYNPFLGMWITVTRQARWYDGTLHSEEALTREQALRFYTRNNAYLLSLEDQVGTLEPGKRADLVVLDTDILTCPADKIKDTQALQTYLDGKLVFERK